jgi:hypothetical protein
VKIALVAVGVELADGFFRKRQMGDRNLP